MIEDQDGVAPANEDGFSSIASRIVEGRSTKDEIAVMLHDLNAKGYGPGEFLELARSFRNATVRVSTGFPAVADLCGTGGGRLRTFNISTVASFVVAGAGVPVAKHGNRSNAGACGSADLMEALGADLSLRPEEAGRILDEVGLGFFFAPNHNPAMKNAASARKEVGGKTIFNVLGPLLNPVVARRRQLIGVYEPSLLDIVPQVLDSLGIERGLVVHGAPGMDEASILGPTEIVETNGGSLDRYVIEPKDFGIRPARPSDLADRPPLESARLARAVLSGDELGPARDAVLLNAGCCLFAFGSSGCIGSGLALAEEAIDSGMAGRKLSDFIAMNEEIRKERESA